MLFAETAIAGAFQIEIEPHCDERGLFARTYCAQTFKDRGLVADFVQASTSFNPKRGTLRGLHAQEAPRQETKLVRATRGRLFDIALDLRIGSRTYLRHAFVELDADRRNGFYIPAGCAHGFLTLSDDCEVFYQISETHVPELTRTFRWNDPAFGIAWPAPPSIISPRDANAEDFRP